MHVWLPSIAKHYPFLTEAVGASTLAWPLCHSNSECSYLTTKDTAEGLLVLHCRHASDLGSEQCHEPCYDVSRDPYQGLNRLLLDETYEIVCNVHTQFQEGHAWAHSCFGALSEGFAKSSHKDACKHLFADELSWDWSDGTKDLMHVSWHSYTSILQFSQACLCQISRVKGLTMKWWIF